MCQAVAIVQTQMTPVSCCMNSSPADIAMFLDPEQKYVFPERPEILGMRFNGVKWAIFNQTIET
jgi:hypothetical protein